MPRPSRSVSSFLIRLPSTVTSALPPSLSSGAFSAAPPGAGPAFHTRVELGLLRTGPACSFSTFSAVSISRLRLVTGMRGIVKKARIFLWIWSRPHFSRPIYGHAARRSYMSPPQHCVMLSAGHCQHRVWSLALAVKWLCHDCSAASHRCSCCCVLVCRAQILLERPVAS
jgi:hypothetical protein